MHVRQVWKSQEHISGQEHFDAFVLRWATLAMCNAFFTFGEARIWLSGHACVAVVCTRTEQTS